MPVEPGFQALEYRRQQLDAIRENSSRFASSHASYTSKGIGEFKVPDVVRFTCTFIDRPSLSHGLSMVEGTQALVDTRFPRVTAGVHKWLQDVNGFYVGAWVFFVVDVVGMSVPTTVTKDPIYSMVHDLTFTGTAVKALPAHLLH